MEIKKVAHLGEPEVEVLINSGNVTALLPLFSGGDTAISLSTHGRKYHCH